jgi:hypothetical protein
MWYLHDVFHRAERGHLFNRLVTLVRRCADMILEEQVVLRGLTTNDQGEVQAMISHQYSPFVLHPYPVNMIEELQP